MMSVNIPNRMTMIKYLQAMLLKKRRRKKPMWMERSAETRIIMKLAQSFGTQFLLIQGYLGHRFSRH